MEDLGNVIIFSGLSYMLLMNNKVKGTTLVTIYRIFEDFINEPESFLYEYFVLHNINEPLQSV